MTDPAQSKQTIDQSFQLDGNTGGTGKSSQNNQGIVIARFPGGTGRLVQWTAITGVAVARVGPWLFWQLLPVPPTLSGC